MEDTIHKIKDKIVRHKSFGFVFDKSDLRLMDTSIEHAEEFMQKFGSGKRVRTFYEVILQLQNEREYFIEPIKYTPYELRTLESECKKTHRR